MIQKGDIDLIFNTQKEIEYLQARFKVSTRKFSLFYC